MHDHDTCKHLVTYVSIPSLYIFRMAKSRKEIQKNYRERQKLKGSQFLQKERERQRQYYLPADKLSKKKRGERNQKNKLRNRLCRFRKRQREENDNPRNEATSGYDSGGFDESDENSHRLIVRLPSTSRSSAPKAKGLKKTRTRALSRAHKNIGNLKEEIETLRKRHKTKDKKIERLTKKIEQTKTAGPSELTPRKQTDIEIEQLNLTPNRKRFVRRKLLLSNSLLSQLKSTRKLQSAKKRQVLHKIVSGGITKKYRCLNSLSLNTGLSRRSLHNVKTGDLVNKVEKRKCLTRCIASSVCAFYTRDDNSRVQPGKADAKKIGTGEKIQTRVLTDYLRNLHNKYRSENPTIYVSLTTFGRLRPKHVLLAAFISRNTCQCIHHQNMALRVQAVRKCGVKISENPENLILHIDDMDTLLSSLPEKVPYKVWKKVELENGRTKMKIVEVESESTQFKEDMKMQTKAFTEHVDRVREQYSQIKKLKENIQENEVIVQMDFAENFSCRSLDEIQTAYWNQTSVTIHPVVAYYRKNGELCHKSLVFVSDEISHSSGTVMAFIDKLVPALKAINNQFTVIHYWTDSPSSQYRNRFIFYLVANHAAFYGLSCRWNYFEVGHGKGPCDGLGGTTKRLADQAVRQGHAVIQDAREFFSWAIKSNMTGVQFIYVSSEQTKAKHTELKSIKAKPLNQTMKLHAVGATDDSSKLMTRNTSCYCNICIGGAYCDSWRTQNFIWSMHMFAHT